MALWGKQPGDGARHSTSVCCSLSAHIQAPNILEYGYAGRPPGLLQSAGRQLPHERRVARHHAGQRGAVRRHLRGHRHGPSWRAIRASTAFQTRKANVAEPDRNSRRGARHAQHRGLGRNASPGPERWRAASTPTATGSRPARVGRVGGSGLCAATRRDGAAAASAESAAVQRGGAPHRSAHAGPSRAGRSFAGRYRTARARRRRLGGDSGRRSQA